jgi:hypothetical protein
MPQIGEHFKKPYYKIGLQGDVFIDREKAIVVHMGQTAPEGLITLFGYGDEEIIPWIYILTHEYLHFILFEEGVPTNLHHPVIYSIENYLSQYSLGNQTSIASKTEE